MTYRAGEQVYHLGEGGFIWLPSGLPHAFRVTGHQPVRFLSLTVPWALDELYAEVGLPATHRRLPWESEARGLPEEIERWNEIGPRYGLEVVGPPLPEDS